MCKKYLHCIFFFFYRNEHLHNKHKNNSHLTPWLLSSYMWLWKEKWRHKITLIETEQRASKFLTASNFLKGGTYRGSIICNEPSDVFAADIRCHKNCLYKYILQVTLEIKKINQYNTKADDFIGKHAVVTVFEKLSFELDLICHGYTLPECCEKANKLLIARARIHVWTIVN